MQTPAFYDAPTATVTTQSPDGRVVRVPIGDFLRWQAREANRLRQAAIDDAIDRLLQRLRMYWRGAPRLAAQPEGRA